MSKLNRTVFARARIAILFRRSSPVSERTFPASVGQVRLQISMKGEKSIVMLRCLKDGIRKPRCNRIMCCGFAAMLLLVPVSGYAQVDPGIRGGPPGAGQAFASGLTAGDLSFFNDPGLSQFTQVEAVADGLGPRFNLDSCAGCHIFPAVGGSSPPTNNPQVVRAPTMAPGSTVPSFLNINGPVREVRFVRNPDGTPDGGVHDIFTIVGRSDNPNGCAIQQPNFSAYPNNLVFRIPTPTFGLGLIESITDTTIRNNLASDPLGQKLLLGITGHVNTNGNDGTVTRFGWKAQNKSLLIFAGEAYNVEMGITNELFQTERDETPTCLFNGTPENKTNFGAATVTEALSDITKFAAFMRFLAPPEPAAETPSNARGRSVFAEIGCALCHTPSLATGRSSSAALSEKPVRLFSDLLLHRMGPRLADDIVQGVAGPDEFRTALLWGLGQRIFFLHDGRTTDLVEAIEAHASPGNADVPPSEANAVIARFHALGKAKQQDLLDFLRSL